MILEVVYCFCDLDFDFFVLINQIIFLLYILLIGVKQSQNS